MKKMSSKAKAFNTKKANAGHDRQARRRRIRAGLRYQTKNYVYRPMQFTPQTDPGIADVPVVAEEKLTDTDTVKL